MVGTVVGSGNCEGGKGLEENRGEYLSGQKGQTVNLVAYAFTGSNPVSPSGSVQVSQEFEQDKCCWAKGCPGIAGVVQW